MLQQPLDDRRLPLGFDLKHRFGKPFIGGRSEEPRALHRRLVLGQRREQRLDDLAEHRARLRQILRRNAQMPLPVPLLEKFLEDLVNEDAELFRIQRRFVFRILLESRALAPKKTGTGTGGTARAS